MNGQSEIFFSALPFQVVWCLDILQHLSTVLAQRGVYGELALNAGAALLRLGEIGLSVSQAFAFIKEPLAI